MPVAGPSVLIRTCGWFMGSSSLQGNAESGNTMHTNGMCQEVHA